MREQRDRFWRRNVGRGVGRVKHRRIAAAGMLAGLFSLLPLPQEAFADEWSFQQQGGAFGDPVSLALVMSDDMQYAFMLRCQGRSEPMYVMLGVPEVYRTPITNAELLIRVDDGEAFARHAIVDGAPIQMRFTAPLASLLFVELANVQRRIAVAVRIGSQIVHERDYPVANFAETYSRLKEACWF